MGSRFEKTLSVIKHTCFVRNAMTYRRFQIENTTQYGPLNVAASYPSRQAFRYYARVTPGYERNFRRKKIYDHDSGYRSKNVFGNVRDDRRTDG